MKRKETKERRDKNADIMQFKFYVAG